MNIQHSSSTPEWGTPPYIIEMVRRVLGTIDFDPASSVRWNATVGAKHFLTQADDGLVTPWPTGVSIYCNPPGGRVGKRSQTAMFWEKLMRLHEGELLAHAIFMAFSAEALQNTQGKGVRPIIDFTFCVPSKRIKFVSSGVARHAPSHSNVIVYVPGSVDNTDLFCEVFSTIGACK